jgi:mono/diheme cytochrome c family protein
MKKVIKIVTIIAWTGASFSSLQASEKTPQELFAANCTSCHITVHQEDESKLLAPPIMGVVRHVKEKYGTKEEAVKFLVDYIQNPSKEKATCEDGPIKKFGVMPSLKGAVSPEDLEKIAGYVYDTYPNGGGRGHGKGQGKGYGKHRGQGHGYGRHGQGKGQGRHGGGHGKGRQAQEGGQ